MLNNFTYSQLGSPIQPGTISHDGQLFFIHPGLFEVWQANGFTQRLSCRWQEGALDGPAYWVAEEIE